MSRFTECLKGILLTPEPEPVEHHHWSYWVGVTAVLTVLLLTVYLV